MVDLKCPECSCTIPPDATRCPNCGHKYDEVVVKTPPKSNWNGITVRCVSYATKCDMNGKIFIRTGVATAPTMCPFC
jgi:hypothetical protein